MTQSQLKNHEVPHVTIIERLLKKTRLNLTAASRIHIVEPQWNPSVEDQAIARALRMGQQREVMIFRYVLKNTVEQVRF